MEWSEPIYKELDEELAACEIPLNDFIKFADNVDITAAPYQIMSLDTIIRNNNDGYSNEYKKIFGSL